MSVDVELRDVELVADYFREAPAVAKRAASMAINQTVQRVGLGRSRRLMLQQTAFPPGYLTDPSRFGVQKTANPDDLESIVSARTRPTSLARFAAFGAKQGAVVTVNPGRPKTMSRAFLIRLRNGNTGLAIRLRPGEDVQNRRFPVKRLANGLVLLYGPSVDQVFRDVRSEVAPEVLATLESEFLRQFARLSRG